MGLYKHNLIAFNKLISSINLGNDKRLCIIQPTGTGKSYLSDAIINHFATYKVLYITANTDILNQFKETFTHSNTEYCTYYNLENDQYLEQLLNQDYHVIILDEFHRTGAKIWKQRIDQLLNKHNNSYVIGLTATKFRYQKNEEGTFVNMAKVLFDNNIVHELTIEKCFELGILPYPKYIQAIYDIKVPYKKLISKVKFNTKSEPIKRKNLIDKIEFQKVHWNKTKGIKKIFKKYITTERNFILFSKNVKDLENIEERILDWFSLFNIPVNIFKVHTYKENSEQELNSFKLSCANFDNQFNIILSISKLNEGLHVPNIHGVIFLRPTKSNVVYFQQLGRCLSSKGEQPLVFDLVNNFSNQQNILSLNKHNKRKKPIFSEKEEIQIKEGLKSHYKKLIIYDETLDIKTFFKETVKSIDFFMTNYNLVLKEAKEHKDYHLLSNSSRTFLSTQKQYYQNYIITERISPKGCKTFIRERKILLDKLSDYNINWLDNYVVRYSLDEQIDTIINNLLDKPKNKKFLAALTKFKSYYLNRLSKKQMARLDKINPHIGFDWRIGNSASNIIKWESRYNTYYKLIKTKGWNSATTEAKVFFGDLRGNIKKYKPPLSEQQKRKVALNKKVELIRLGKSDITLTNEQKQKKIFQDTFELLKKELEIYSNEDIPYNHLSAPHKKWFNDKKRNICINTTTSDILDFQANLFDSVNLGFDWRTETALDKIWQLDYEKAKSDIEENGYINSSKTTKRFLAKLRQPKALASLEANYHQRLHLLNKLNPLLGFDWKVPRK